MKDLINCPAERAIYFLGGKWKIRILFTLYNSKKVRFNELKKVLRKIQFGMQMNANRQVARELVSLGFHNQKEYNQIVQRMNDRTINEYYKKY